MYLLKIICNLFIYIPILLSITYFIHLIISFIYFLLRMLNAATISPVSYHMVNLQNQRIWCKQIEI